MLQHFAGPIEVHLPIEAVIIGTLIVLVVYSAVVFAASWFVTMLLAFYARHYAPDTKFNKALTASGHIKSFALCLFVTSFISTLTLVYVAWPYFDRLGDVASVVLFTSSILIVPICTSVTLFTARHKTQ